jgi:hypothetical protein
MTQAAWTLVLLAQDIFERERQERPRLEKVYTKDRVELSAAVPVVSGTGGRREIEIGAAAAEEHSFLCGRFNPMAGIRALVSEDMASEATGMLLDMAEGELVSNGMTLLCQASPTLCDVLKHYRFSAQALLKLNYDKCRAIDDALQNATKRMQAEATKECLKRKLQEGKSLPEAMRECEREYPQEPLRDLGGERVRQIDLNRQLEKLFGRGAGEEELLQDLKIGATGASGRWTSDRAERMYEEARKSYEKKWSEAEAAGAEQATEEMLAGLVPEWAGFRATRQDLTALASMEERRRSIALGQLASDLAMLELSKKIRELDSKLSAAKTKAELTPGAPQELVERIEAERKELQRSFEELSYSRNMSRMAGESFRKFLDAAYGWEIEAARREIEKMAAPGVGPREKNKPYDVTKIPCCTTGSSDWGK